MIAKKEIKSFWIDYVCLMLNWNSLSFLALISTAVIWAFILKNYLGVKKEFWILNNTVDGDFGAEWWLEREGLKPGVVSAFLWWFRNHSWNWIRTYNPPWDGGGAEEFLVIKDTLNKKDEGRWTRANKKKGIYGIYITAFRIHGKVLCRFSYANKYFHIQMGAGGDRYRFKFSL